MLISIAGKAVSQSVYCFVTSRTLGASGPWWWSWRPSYRFITYFRYCTHKGRFQQTQLGKAEKHWNQSDETDQLSRRRRRQVKGASSAAYLKSKSWLTGPRSVSDPMHILGILARKPRLSGGRNRIIYNRLFFILVVVVVVSEWVSLLEKLFGPKDPRGSIFWLIAASDDDDSRLATLRNEKLIPVWVINHDWLFIARSPGLCNNLEEYDSGFRNRSVAAATEKGCCQDLEQRRRPNES